MQYSPCHRRSLWFIIASRTPLLAGSTISPQQGQSWEFLPQLGDYLGAKKNSTAGEAVQKDLGKISFFLWSKLGRVRGHAPLETNSTLTPSPIFQLCCWVSHWRFLYFSTGTGSGPPELHITRTWTCKLLLHRDYSLHRKDKMKDGKEKKSVWTKLMLQLRVTSENQGFWE